MFFSVLAVCWVCVGSVLVMCGQYVDNCVFLVCWECVGSVLGVCQECVGNVFLVC